MGRAGDQDPSTRPTTSSDDRPVWHSLHLWQIQPIRDVLFILAGVGLLAFGALLQSITVPLLIGLGLAYLVEPLVRWLGRKWSWCSRNRVVVGIMVLLLVGLVGLSALLLPRAVGQAVTFAKKLPTYVDTATTWMASEEAPALIRDVGTQLQELRREAPVEEADQQSAAAAGEIDVETVRGVVQEVLREQQGERRTTPEDGGRSLSAIGRVVGSVGMFLAGLVTGTIDVLLTLFLICFFFVVFSISYPRVEEFIEGFLPAGKKDRIKELWGKMDAAISGFVRGRLTIALILSGVFAIGWSLCGVPHAIVLGLVIGFFTLIPYLSGIGLPAAWILLALESIGRAKAGEAGFYISGDGDSASVAWLLVLVMPTIVFIVAQLLDDWVLSPIIQGHATNLSAASIIVAVLAGGTVAGLYGMLLAIPAAACIRILAVDVVLPDVRDWLAGRRKDPLPIDE